MTTANDLTNAANSLLSFIQTRTQALERLETQFIALSQPENASASGALAEFNKLAKLRDAESDIWNRNTQYTSFIQLYNSAPESAKTEAVKALKNSVVSNADSYVVLGRNQRNVTIPATKQAIQNAVRGVAPNDTPLQPPQPTREPGQPGRPAPPNPNLPGRRLKNPLGWFSSYTYQLTLYMMSQQGYTDYVNQGKNFVPRNGSRIIAQSGGTPKDRRPLNMPFDYYIDNLRIEQAITGKDTQTATNTTEAAFTIIEPYGFSLITKLKLVSADLSTPSTGGHNIDGAKLTNPMKNFFVIGIRFYGYDEEGNIMSGDKVYDGSPLDPNWQGGTDGQAVFERFIDFTVSDFKFKIDGKATIYNVSGVVGGPGQAAGTKRGMINSNLQMQAKTVKEALAQLMDKLNKDQQLLVDSKKIKYKNNYAILGINDNLDRTQYPLPPGLDAIFNSSMILPENKAKNQSGTSTAQNTTQVNEKKGANSTPNIAKNLKEINRDTPVLQAIQQIISGSTYLRDAMTEVNKTQTEPNNPGQGTNVNTPDTQKRLRWYNVSPQVSEGKYDPNTADYAYDILYIIRPYETPVVNATYVSATGKYPGPHKRYEYWYTGQNSEIISYEQSFDLLYWMPGLNPAVDKDGKGTQAGQTSVVPQKASGADRTGFQDKGKEAQNTFITDLFDPKAYTDVKMTILGDPDYLMQTTESIKGLNQAYRKYYGSDNFTINPNGGQVFVEVDFNEAIDYDTDKGFLDVNDSIRFWDYPKELPIKGVSYQLIKVTHNFQNGKFTQVLNMQINNFGYPPPKEPEKPKPPGATGPT